MKYGENIKSLLFVSILLLFLTQCYYLNSQTIFKMPTRPYGAVIVDYDLDGDNDLIVGCSAIGSNDIDSIVIMFNDGWGNFDIQGFEANNDIFIYCEDLNNNGYPDIISRDADSVFFHENNQQGGLGNYYSICNTDGNRRIGGISDMDTNGFSDIVYFDIQKPYGWGIVYNEGNNVFLDDYFYSSNSGALLRAVVGDLNNNDISDVLVTSNLKEEGAYAMINNIESFDKNMIVNENWSQGFIVNLDNESENDVGLINQSSSILDSTTVYTFSNVNQTITLEDSAFLIGGGRINNIIDFDLDGYPDLSVTVSSWIPDPAEDSIFIYHNDQNWNFNLIHEYYIGEHFLPSLISGDLNMDGYPDILAIGYLDPTVDYIQILWNDRNGGFIDTNNVYVYVKERRMNELIHLFPNPSPTGCFKLQSYSGKIKTVKIFNLSGKIIFKVNFSCQDINIDLSNLDCEPGLYVCLIELEKNKTIIKKLLIKN